MSPLSPSRLPLISQFSLNELASIHDFNKMGSIGRMNLNHCEWEKFQMPVWCYHKEMHANQQTAS